MLKREPPLVEDHVQVIRLSPGATKVVLSLAENYTGIQTHWTGRTLVCPGTDDCPGCLAQIETRWLGYLPIAHGKGIYALLEISAQAAPRFDRLRGDGSLHNLVIEIRKGRRFEPIEIVRSKPAKTNSQAPVTHQKVIDQLARIFALPRHREGEPIAQWETRLQTAAAARLAVAVRARSR